MKKIIKTGIFIGALLFNTVAAFAQGGKAKCKGEAECRDLLPQIGAGDGATAPLPSGDLKFEILPRLIKIFFGLTGAITTVIFVYSGVMLVTHLGNEEVITKFKKALIYSAVGLAIITTAYGIVFGILKLQF